MAATFSPLMKGAKLPPRLPKQKWPKGTIVAVEKGEAAPFPGILMAEKRAEYVARLRIEYDRLYDTAEAALAGCRAGLGLCSDELVRQARHVSSLRGKLYGWWSRYGPAVTFALGFAIGAAVSVGIAVAVEEAKTK